MAQPNSLRVGNTVTHPEWRGQKAIVTGFRFFQRYSAKKRRPVEDKGVRIVLLDRPMPDDNDYSNEWMETGLENVST